MNGVAISLDVNGEGGCVKCEVPFCGKALDSVVQPVLWHRVEETKCWTGIGGNVAKAVEWRVGPAPVERGVGSWCDGWKWLEAER